MAGKKVYHEARKAVLVRLTPVMARRLSVFAANHEQSLSQAIAGAVDQWWESQPDRKKYESVVGVVPAASVAP